MAKKLSDSPVPFVAADWLADWFAKNPIEYGESVTQDWNSLNESQFKNAFAYFVTYGTRQSGADVSANYAAIAGVKQNGDTTKADIEPYDSVDKLAKKSGLAFTGDRKAFADAYFSKLETERFGRVLNGTLRSVGRGPAYDPVARDLFEAHITAKVKDAAKAKALRANKEAYRAMYDKYTEAFKGKIMEETARRAEAKIESADIESDIFAELEK